MTTLKANSRSGKQWGQPGYSLPEALIASVVLVIVLLAIYMVYDTGIQDSARGTAKADVQQNVRVALASMARELRMAGYTPSTASCANPPAGAVTAIGASPVSVTFQADLDSNSCMDRVVYKFTPATSPTKPCDPSDSTSVGRITRSAQEWNGASWIPTTPTEYDIAQCVKAMTITYFDSAGAETVTPANVTRINISITGEENTRGWGAKSYTLSSDVRLRNL